jgi:hypothetical protein
MYADAMTVRELLVIVSVWGCSVIVHALHQGSHVTLHAAIASMRIVFLGTRASTEVNH